MRTTRAYLGFIPAILVAIPCAVAAIRQALYYKGCMDGLGFVIVAFFAFVAGGVLNAGFLAYVGWSRRRYFDFAERRHAVIARAGTVVAGLLLVVQLAVVFYFWILKCMAA
jgi:hypothetical protein